MDPSSIIAVIVVLIMIVTHIIKSIRENAEAARRQQLSVEDDDELVIMRPKKPVKQQVPNKQRLADRQLLAESLSPFVDARTDSSSSQRQALVKRLAPQGQGQRFEADPGTLDAASIVASTIDPTVKPELDSMTGIYEQDAAAKATRRTAPTIELHISDCLKTPEGICQAVLLAEILKRPAWADTDSFTSAKAGG